MISRQRRGTSLSVQHKGGRGALYTQKSTVGKSEDVKLELRKNSTYGPIFSSFELCDVGQGSAGQACSIALNVFTTGMIAGRIWYHQRRFKHSMSADNSTSSGHVNSTGMLSLRSLISVSPDTRSDSATYHTIWLQFGELHNSLLGFWSSSSSLEPSTQQLSSVRSC